MQILRRNIQGFRYVDGEHKSKEYTETREALFYGVIN